MVDNINFLLDVGQGRSQAIISYNQVLNYLEKGNQDDETLCKFRAIRPLKKDDPNYNGSLYDVMVEYKTGETKKPLSIIAKMIQPLVQHMPININYYTYLNGINSNT